MGRYFTRAGEPPLRVYVRFRPNGEDWSLDAVRIGGTVAIIGVSAGARAPVDVLPILMRQIRCQGVFVGPRAAFDALVATYTRHGLRPPVDRTVPYREAPRAVLALDRADHVGKIGIVAEAGG